MAGGLGLVGLPAGWTQPDPLAGSGAGGGRTADLELGRRLAALAAGRKRDDASLPCSLLHFPAACRVALCRPAPGRCSDSSGSRSSAVTAATTPTTVAAGPPAFLAEVKRMEFGDKDFSAGPDDALLSLGNTVCEGLSDSGLNFGRVVQGLTQSDAHPTTEGAPGSHWPSCDTSARNTLRLSHEPEGITRPGCRSAEEPNHV